jgi:5-methylcytosine-specific restriction endonuclease McrA
MRCAYCGIALRHDRAPLATLDHIVPRSAGGNDQFHNLALACSTCQRAKGAQLPTGLWSPQYRVETTH